MAASPQPLVLYKLVPLTQVQDCIEHNLLPKEDKWWYIGFRQCGEEAVARAVHVEGGANKDSHAMLVVEFSPLGVAHFTTTFEDKTYQFQPVLHKICSQWATYDKGVWHFTRDLPLSLSDDQGNYLVRSQWMEIM
jgi:hypothetical protein